MNAQVQQFAQSVQQAIFYQETHALHAIHHARTAKEQQLIAQHATMELTWHQITSVIPAIHPARHAALVQMNAHHAMTANMHHMEAVTSVMKHANRALDHTAGIAHHVMTDIISRTVVLMIDIAKNALFHIAPNANLLMINKFA